jgi:lysophospholipase L1-like esterase
MTGGAGDNGRIAPAVRIVALGDSITAGTPRFRSPLEAPPDGDGDVTSQYAYWLMRAHPEWEVLDRGVDGERSDQIQARFGRDVGLASPVAVVVIAGVNDIYQGLPAAHVIACLDAIYRQGAATGIAVVAGTIIPFDTATPEQNRRMHEVNAWIRRRADDSPGIAAAETRAAVASSGNADFLSLTEDHLHPTPAGYRAMAGAIRPVIERILR